MKQLIILVPMLLFLVSCIENKFDSGHDDKATRNPVSLNSILTKSSTIEQEDSLTMISKQQSDVDNLMMGRVIEKEGRFVLALKREDAAFLGVSDKVYDSYLEFVDLLNAQLSE